VAAAVPVTALTIYLGVAMGWYCRMLEHQADLWACRQLTPAGGRAGDSAEARQAVEGYIAALEQLVTCHPDRNRSSWLHPSIRRRADFLRIVAGDDCQRARFERTMQTAAILLATAVPGCLVFPLLPL
jgi:hypothetical protein